MTDHKRKSKAAFLSVISNSSLVVMKLFIGLLIGSVSVISEAIHSGVDLLAAGIALFAVKKASKPADKRHPFGHGKVENISGTIEAILIFVAALWIIVEAAKKMINPQPIDSVGWGVIVMLISAIANFFISRMLFRVGNETDSVALQADAWHLRTDVYTSAGVMGALAVIFFGNIIKPGINLNWIDPIAAIFVAMLIMRAAYDLTKKAARDLVDTSLPFEEQKKIRDSVLNHKNNIIGFHDLRTRKAGSERFVEMHLVVDSKLSVETSHKITDDISNDIQRILPETEVTIHVEPCNGNCTSDCEHDCEKSMAAKRKKSPQSGKDL
jgi:cation diffusion facilitator family transporter